MQIKNVSQKNPRFSFEVSWSPAEDSLAIGLFPVFGRREKDNAVIVMNLVENPPRSDPYSPSRRLPVAQPSRGRHLAGAGTENRVIAFRESVFQTSGGSWTEAL